MSGATNLRKLNLMNLLPESQNMDRYLQPSEVVGSDNPAIRSLALFLTEKITDEVERAKALYEFVRDQIPHSFDIQGDVVTCTASEVLEHRQGICFAKSHLLAALLRPVGIPAGFCYQKLVFDDMDPDYKTLHGLNGIYLKSLNKWIRVDARGNKPGVHAEFSTEEEILAFPVRPEMGEVDYPVIYVEPNSKVVDSLRTNRSCLALAANLPADL